jgi:hypothetical protein
VYRRPLDDGKGFKALFVILNESGGDIELPLEIRDPKRILGGPNTQRGRDVLGRVTVPGVLGAAWQEAVGGGADAPVLADLESGERIARIGSRGERYGPVFVPYHDYRVLYGESRQ